VILELLIGEDGAVQEATAITGQAPFSDAAVTTARTWRFEPARRGARRVSARIRVQVQFIQPEPEPEPAAVPTPATTSGSPDDAVQGDVPPSTPDRSEPATVDVIVHGERVVGVKSLGRAEVRQMPGAFGDPYRAIESLPGVTPIASGLPYFFIRGAPPGNVGYFFDDVSVPLLFHVAVGPGVLHPAFIDSVDLYSGAYPAKFGRYAGGIVVGTAAQPEWRMRGEASIRIVDAGAFVEVPFADGRGSAMLGGRYSYTGLIASLLSPDATVGYWDYQGRIAYDLASGDRLTLFGFGSHDYLSAVNDAGVEQPLVDLTFHRVQAKYSKQLSARTALDLRFKFGHDHTGVGGDPNSTDEDPLAITSRNLGAQLEAQHRLSKETLLRGGADLNFSHFSIDLNPPSDDDDDDDGPRQAVSLSDQLLPQPGFPIQILDQLEQTQDDANEAAFNRQFLTRDDILSSLWLDSVLDLGSGVTLTPGLRFDVYDTGGDVATALEPRVAVRYDLNDTVSITHDFGIAHQPPSFALPIPGLSGAASRGLQRAFQSSAGVESKMPLGMLGSVTLFQNVVLNSTDLFGVANLRDGTREERGFIDRTTAHSYGAEFYLRRPLTDEVGGFLSYTLSRSTRSVPLLSGLSSFDRTHVISGAIAFDLGARWRLGTRAFVYSGIPARVAYAEALPSPPRTPWFYRIDWRLEKSWLIGTDGAWWALVLEVLNTTLNKEGLNTSCYAYGCVDNRIGPVFIPSIGVEASF